MLNIYDRQSLTWFSRLVRHPARKQSGLFLQPRSPYGANTLKMKKTLTGDKTAARGAKQFYPAADRLTGGPGWPKVNQLEMVTTFTYKHSLVKLDSHNFELSW